MDDTGARVLGVSHLPEGRTAGFLGQPYVNVLELNLALWDLTVP